MALSKKRRDALQGAPGPPSLSVIQLSESLGEECIVNKLLAFDKADEEGATVTINPARVEQHQNLFVKGLCWPRVCVVKLVVLLPPTFHERG